MLNPPRLLTFLHFHRECLKTKLDLQDFRAEPSILVYEGDQRISMVRVRAWRFQRYAKKSVKNA